MKKSIAVVCALPPERNTGMVTVDLAAHRYFRKFHPQADVTIYSFGKATPYGYGENELPFVHHDIMENRDRYLASDIFVFWGDFIHSRSYQTYTLGDWNLDPAGKPGGLSGRALLEQYCRYTFLTETPESVIRRSIVFGSTIITNEAADDLDLEYKARFDSFFSTIGSVFFRDALSSAKIAPLRQGAVRQGAVRQGCDCALLLEDDDLEELYNFERAPQRSGIGVFFGRSRAKTAMLLFSRIVAAMLNEPCRWLPWFWSGRRVRWPAKLFGYDVPSQQPSPGALLSQLSGCRFVITDTYHVCVNAWRLGIPAICIGEGASVSQHSLADKKKEVLFEMYGARAFYVFLETILSPRLLLPAARQAAAALANEALAGAVCAAIRDHRRMAARGLTEQLQASLHDAAAAAVQVEYS